MLTLDEARGIAAQIWLRPNFRRTPLDPIMCDHVANLLVDEITKATDLDLDKDYAQKLAKLKNHYQSLNDQYERLKLEHANLQSDFDTLKLSKKVEPLQGQAKVDNDKACENYGN